MNGFLLDTNVVSETAKPTAKSQGLALATRNVDHFRGFGVPVYDPFSDSQIL